MPGEDSWEYSRWYEPAVIEYLEANPIPREAGDIELIAIDAAEVCGVSKHIFLKIAKELGIEPARRLGKHHNNALCYNFDQIVLIGEAINAIPVAEETDIPIVELQQELTTNHVPNTLGIYKRRNPVHGVKGWCQHISAEEAAALRASYKDAPVADEGHMAIGVVAKKAGLTLPVLHGYMTDEDRAARVLLRKEAGMGPTDHLPIEVANALIERAKREELPPHLITFSVIKQLIPRSDPVLRA